MGRLQNKRQTIGYAQPSMVNNNVGTTQQSLDKNMSGNGFADIVRGVFDASKIPGKLASKIGTDIINRIPDSDDKARPGFRGEKHMILKLPNGRNGVANFMGPGTKVIKRLRRNDPGRTPSDNVAKRHDLDFALAQNATSKTKQLQQTRKADRRMIRTLKRIANGELGGDSQRNIQAGMKIIQAKVIGEDIGLLSKSKFTGKLKKVHEGDKILLLSERAKLEQAGFGILPGDALKKKLLKNMTRQKRMQALGDRVKTKPIKGGKLSFALSKNPYKTSGKNSGASFSKTLPGMKTYKMTGKGLKLAGQGNLVNFVMKGVLPGLLKSVGIKPGKINKPGLLKLVKKVIKIQGGPKLLVNNLAKTLLPFLVHGKIKTMGKGMSGKGVLELVKTAKKKLHKKLADGLWKAFQSYLKTKQGGSGIGLAGSGFWGDFKKGFLSVVRPASKILGPVATALGHPEIGIPLTILGKVL